MLHQAKLRRNYAYFHHTKHTPHSHKTYASFYQAYLRPNQANYSHLYLNYFPIKPKYSPNSPYHALVTPDYASSHHYDNYLRSHQA